MSHTIEFKYRFEILIPLADDQGRPFPWSRIEQVGEAFLRRFEGCRCQPMAQHLGLWRFKNTVYREGLLLFTVDGPRNDESLEWMLTYKRRLKKQFGQLEIYLGVTELLWL